MKSYSERDGFDMPTDLAKHQPYLIGIPPPQTIISKLRQAARTHKNIIGIRHLYYKSGKVAFSYLKWGPNLFGISFG